MTQPDGPADPLGALEAQLRALRRQDDRLVESLGDTREARRRLAGQIRALEATLSVVRSGGGTDRAELQAGTIGDAVETLLRRDGSLRVIELTAQLQDVGKLLRTDSAYATVFKTLARDPRFRKVSGRRGYWELTSPRREHGASPP